MTRTYRTHADLGGTTGHGAIDPARHDAPWHEPWERRAMALTVAAGATGAWNIDMSRSARETLPDYASRSYFAVWLAALEKLLAERRLVDADEVAAARALRAAPTVPRVLRADAVPAALGRGSPTERAAPALPRFAVGDRVRTYAKTVPHHTRLPRYARDKVGRVERVHGAHVFADAHALGRGEDPRWLYTVRFDARELWGDDAGHGATVSIDAWEPYLAPAA